METKKFEQKTKVRIIDVDKLIINVHKCAEIEIEITPEKSCIVSTKKGSDMIEIISEVKEMKEAHMQIVATNKGIPGIKAGGDVNISVGSGSQFAVGKNIIQASSRTVISRTVDITVRLKVPSGTEIIVDDVKEIIKNFSEEDKIKIKKE